MLYGLLINSPSTWPESKSNSSTTSIGNVVMVDLVDVDVVDLTVGELVHVEMVVQVVRHANQ